MNVIFSSTKDFRSVVLSNIFVFQAEICVTVCCYHQLICILLLVLLFYYVSPCFCYKNGSQ